MNSQALPPEHLADLQQSGLTPEPTGPPGQDQAAAEVASLGGVG